MMTSAFVNCDLFLTGLPRLPYIGSYWHLLWGNYEYPHKTIRYYTKKLKSNLVTCYLGDYIAVVANDYKNIREIMMREDFDGRPTEVEVVKTRAFGKKLGDSL